MFFQDSEVGGLNFIGRKTERSTPVYFASETDEVCWLGNHTGRMCITPSISTGTYCVFLGNPSALYRYSSVVCPPWLTKTSNCLNRRSLRSTWALMYFRPFRGLYHCFSEIAPLRIHPPSSLR